jgi:hypothetical protein
MPQSHFSSATMTSDLYDILDVPRDATPEQSMLYLYIALAIAEHRAQFGKLTGKRPSKRIRTGFLKAHLKRIRLRRQNNSVE